MGIQHNSPTEGKIPNATMFIDTFEDVLTGNAGAEIGYKVLPFNFHWSELGLCI